MINYSDYSIFSFNDSLKVNTVNNEGFMGKGLALETKIRYPKTYDFYINNYSGKKGGDILFDKQNNFIHFFTKESWKGSSKVEWVEKGLETLKELIIKNNIKSVAIPLLGASNGGLNATSVIKLIEDYLGNLENVEVIICMAKKNDSVEQKLVNSIKNESPFIKKTISDKQAKIIKEAVSSNSIILLRDILNIKGIGENTYSKILSAFSKVLVAGMI